MRASRLFTYGRPLVDLLVPPEDGEDPEETRTVRSIATEELIRKGIQGVDGESARQALVILLGLSYVGVPPKMQERRIQAARLLNLKPATFRQGEHESELVRDLAFEIFKAARREEMPGEEGRRR